MPACSKSHQSERSMSDEDSLFAESAAFFFDEKDLSAPKLFFDDLNDFQQLKLRRLMDRN